MRMVVRLLVSSLLPVAAQASTAYSLLERGYAAVRSQDWDNAIQAFQEALEAQPDAHTLKELAYAYLKTGDTVAARDAFAAALKLDPADEQTALEYAFLCHETRETAEARRVFDRVRKSGNAVAATVFENIDRPLRAGIARWTRAVELAPANFTNHEELARLAGQRDELDLAAAHYEAAWRLRPDRRYLLLHTGRIWKLQGKAEKAMSALLAASRSEESETAERALELLPRRYPYVYEFRAALAFEPPNIELQRELAYLLLAMRHKPEAEREFELLVDRAPDDLLSAAQLGFLRLGRGSRDGAQPLLDRVLRFGAPELQDRVRFALGLPRSLPRPPETPRARVSQEAKVLAEQSLKKGYLKDALKYLTIAHENDPVDFQVMLKLGWTNNLLKDDPSAVRWFRRASQSSDHKIAAEADKAYRNLQPALTRMRVSMWALPFYSSRWKNTFSYAQARAEFRLGPLRPYLSLRFIGDLRGRLESSALVAPQYMSEGAAIAGVGLATPVWKGVIAWGEAGQAIRYADRPAEPRLRPDYRGGASYSRGWGRSIASESGGLFFELNGDAVFVSRFGNDTLFYMQTRTGYTLPRLAPLRLQLYWNGNGTSDLKREAWANFTEQGPGLRFRLDRMPPSLTFSINVLRGHYGIRDGNPYPINFRDVRAGLWYAWSH